MAKILWFTGLSGSGKTTITNLLVKKFKELNKNFEIFDGDDVRKKLHKHLGFSKEDILENNRLILELCRESFSKADFILVPIISPFKISRKIARNEFKENFIEIFINCPYEECKKRDVKGLYQQAENGEIQNFIGLHIPYEGADNPDIEIDSINETPEKSCQKILNFLGV